MDFRTLINKLDSFNTEAKKEPERLTFVYQKNFFSLIMEEIGLAMTRLHAS